MPRMILISVLMLILVLVSGCSRSYEWTTTIQDEARRAIVWSPKQADGKVPVVIYFHGRGGTAEDSQNNRQFHTLWPEAVVAYAEGTNFDDANDGKFGWEIRFPHVYNVCGLNKDFEYVNQLLIHIDEVWEIDEDRIFFAGHSSGGFFTLALSQLMGDRVDGVAALGAYTSFAPVPGLIDCDDTYRDAISNTGITNITISAKPVPTYFIFGTEEKTIRPNDQVYDADCAEWSYFQNSIYQLARKNSSVNPICNPGTSESFMNKFNNQVFPGVGTPSAATVVRIYQGDHGWPNGANEWVIDFFKGLD